MTVHFGPNTSRTFRLFVGAVGGYAFAYGYIAFVASFLALLGLARSEAVSFSSVTGILAFTAVIIWSASTKFFVRTTIVIICASAAMIFSAPILVSA
ncbi:MAG: hypothetical protein AAF720_08100 [Pseudomonadota bacterium]